MASKGYLKSKSVSHGVRVYALVPWSSRHLFPVSDNNSGNKMVVDPDTSYAEAFLNLRGAFSRKSA